MKILLDTQAFLWLILDAPTLSSKAKKTFLDSNSKFYLSLASVWEMAIKISLGKLKIHQPLSQLIPHQLQENNIIQLDIHFRHIIRTSTLPFYHRDPFDRLIISQALEEDLSILSSDTAFDSYKVKRIW